MSSRWYIARFLARRIGAAAVLLVLISFGTFALLALTPGDPIQLLLAGKPRTPEIVHSLKEQYHLSGSFTSRYFDWAKSAVQLDFGQSVQTHGAVIDGITARAPLTIQLGLFAFLIVTAIGVPLGILAALRNGGATDRVIVGSTVLGVSIPPFVSGILLIYLFAVSLRWLPTFGPGDSGSDRVRHLILPAAALAVTALAVVVKVTRAAMIRELEQDYVVFARARGVSARTVIWRHAFRNALIPVVTASGLLLAYMVTGAVLVEQVFSLPGLGSLLVNAAGARDLPMLQGVVLVASVVIIGVNLLVDVLYLIIDPRVRVGKEPA